MPTNNNGNDDESLRSKLRVLRASFFDALISLVETKNPDTGKLIPPSAAEMTVIRGVLRDNFLTLHPDDADLGGALEAARVGLPSFPSHEDID